MKKASIKGIILDLDNTLYSYETCNSFAKKELAAYLAKRLKKQAAEITEALREGRHETHARLKNQAASHSRLFYIQHAVEQLTGSTQPALVADAHQYFWQQFFTKMKLRLGVKKFLKDARRAGMRVCVVTNLTAELQCRKLEHLGIDTLIDYVVSSEEAGVEKPNTKPFRIALAKMKLTPAEVISIGDDEEKDVVPAKNMGMRALLIVDFKKAAQVVFKN